MPKNPPPNPGWLAVQRERYGADFIPTPPNNVRSLGDVLDGVLQHLGLAKEAQLAALLPLWPDLVGKTNAAKSRPGRWEGNSLTIYVSHHLWLNEMRRLLPKALLKRLQELYPGRAPSEIRFEMDPDLS